MEMIKLILQYAAWPISLIIVAVFFLFLFRKPISRLLEKTQKISKEGIEVAQVSQEKSLKKEPSFEKLMKTFDYATLPEREKLIESDLDKLNPNEKIKVLIRHLATTQISLRLSDIERAIWGSQEGILNFLNSKATGVDVETVKSFYDVVAEESPEVFADYSFEKYLGFLLTAELIVEKNNQYVITSFGNDFLLYLVATGKTGHRKL
ncbi:MAG: hypothetical protein KAT46_01985 [Deltaproteobacteria bacterium]|nr:hypothetical protein [Deltaproteobacteria bacterium]